MMHWMTLATPGLRLYKAALEERGVGNVMHSLETYLATPLGGVRFQGS